MKKMAEYLMSMKKKGALKGKKKGMPMKESC